MRKIVLLFMLLCTGFGAFAAGHTATVVHSNVSCNGACDGDASAFATGGIGPYGYTWTGPGVGTGSAQYLFGLCPGSYVMTAIDSSDMSTATYAFTITQPPVVTVSLAPGYTMCSGQSVSLIPGVTGGTPGYTYSWSPSAGLSSPTIMGPIASPSATTTYTLVVTDANGCMQMAFTTVNVTPTPTAAASSMPANCGMCNGVITTTSSGGTAFSWTGPGGYMATGMNLSGLCSGSYTLTVSNGSCSSVTLATVGNLPGPAVAVTSATSPTCGACDGSLGTNTTAGTPPYAYTWVPGGMTTPNITGVCAGTYTVTVTDANGCTSSTSTVVNSSSSITGITTSVTDASCAASNGAILITGITGGVAPYTYTWSNGSTTQDLINIPAGTYAVTVTDASGCQFSTGIFVNTTGSMVATGTSTPASCSPCNGTVSIMESGGVAPYIYELNGVTQTTGNFTGVCPGAYVATVTDVNGCIAYYTVFVNSTGIPAFSITDSTNSESAFGMSDGSIFLYPSGSTGPYTFLWSNGATTQDIYSLPGGSYTVLITDSNGDCASYTFVVGTNPSYGHISGFLYNDVNANCVYDAGDYPLPGYYVSVTSGTYSGWGYTNSLGYYVVTVPNGSYNVTPVTSSGLGSGCTTSYSVSVTGGSINAGNNFYYSLPLIHDVCVSAWTSGIVPGFNGMYYVYVNNYGTAPASGTVCIYLPSVLSYVSSLPAGASVSGDTVCFSYSGIAPAGYASFVVNFYTPPSVPLGTVLVAEINATLTSGTDINPACNTYLYSRVVTGSFDPNDKTPSPSGEGITGDIPVSEDELSYLIRFQNTGTGPAVNIVVDDTLSSMLDPLSFEMLNASHAYTVEMLAGNVIRWRFSGINLPDSTSNEPGSHGHVQFKINTASTPMVGQVVTNKAYIYFDFNEPVITNTAVNTYAAPTTVEQQMNREGSVKVFPNPFSESTVFVISTPGLNEVYTFELSDVVGKKVMEMQSITEKEFSISRTGLQNGIYFYRISSAERLVGIGKVVIR